MIILLYCSHFLIVLFRNFDLDIVTLMLHMLILYS